YSHICTIPCSPTSFSLFFFKHPATTHIYTLSLHDALPISKFKPTSLCCGIVICRRPEPGHSLTLKPRYGTSSAIDETREKNAGRSEEHTSELQSPCNLVCRLLLEKKKKK